VAGIVIGSVSVAVVPSLASGDFFEKVRVKVLPEADDLGVDIGEHIRTGIDETLTDISFTIKAKLDDADAIAQIDALKLKADELGAKTETIKVKVDNTGTSALGKAETVAKDTTEGGSGGNQQSALPGVLGTIADNPGLAAGVGGAAIAGLPFVAQAAAGSIVAILGGAFAAIGIEGVKSNKDVQDSFTDVENTAKAALQAEATPFVKVMEDISQAADNTISFLAGPIGDEIAKIAQPFDKFATTLIGAFQSPAVVTSIDAVGTAFDKILKALTPQLPGDINNVALGITRVANAVASDPKAFADFVSFLIDSAGFALNMIADLTRVATYIEGHWGELTFGSDIVASIKLSVSAYDEFETESRAVTNVVIGYYDNFLDHFIAWGVGYLQVVSKAFGWIPGIGGQIKTFTSNAEQDLLALGTSTTNYGSVAAHTASGAVTVFTTSINQMGIGSTKTTTDTNNLATAVQEMGTKSDLAKSARLQLITDLENSGVKASTATTMVNDFVAALGKIPANKPTNFTASVTPATFKISETAGSVDDPIGELHLSAAGSRVPGFGGGDKHLYLLEGGEAVVDKFTTARNADTLKAWGVPGFQSGGLAGLSDSVAAGVNSLGTAWGGAVKTDAQAALQADIQAALNADAAKMKAAAAAAASAATVSGSGAAVQALAKEMAAARGWTGALWNDLNAVEMAEAGWNLTAQNPSSDAYGIAQFINGASEYATYGGNATTASGQITAFLNYIAQRYGSPAAAWAHEEAFHWYDGGGMLGPGSFGFNGLSRPEAVLTPEQGDWLRSAGTAGSSGKHEKLLTRIAEGVERMPSAMGGHMGRTLNGVASAAGHRGRYAPSRGGING
jgi:hypothetical protein